MARFDPTTYPDRLAFEATARRIRSQEIGRVFAAASLAVPAVVMLASSEEAEAQTKTKQNRDTRQEGRQGKRDQRRN